MNRWRHWLFAVVAVCLLGDLRADVVTDWNALMLDCIRQDTTAPPISARNLAILNTAIHDAVNSFSRTHQPYRFDLSAPAGSSSEAAAVGAGYEVCLLLYPSFAAWADDQYGYYLAGATPGMALTNGLEFGRWIARLAVNARSDDGSNTEIPYIPSNEPGQWQRTPPLFRPPLTPHWRYVEPFCLSDIEPFVPPPPPALDGAEYAAAVNEVKALGGKHSAVRSAEQSQIAVFWSDFSYTAMPPGHWHEIAMRIAHDRQNTIAENARLFALLSLSQADAAIVCWEAKYRFNLWRPITAIQRADEDGNPATLKDSSWDHFLASPPFPAYTSGHSTFSKAAATVIAGFYGTDAIPFVATSDSLPGVTRNFTSLAACADEIGMSRIYGGIHFQFDNVRGKDSGRMVGDFISRNFLLANDKLPQVHIEGFTSGSPRLRLHARAGTTCVVEASSDMKAWHPISTNTAAIGGAMVLDSRTALPASCFYRARQL